MIMVKTDFNLVRYNLTYAIRYLELLLDKGKKFGKPDSILSEYEYWISTLDLIRNCVYECVDHYDGQVNIGYAVMEVQSEITNFIYVVKKLTPAELQKLDNAYKHLKIVGEQLNGQ